jgi:hypothetical protein
MKPLQTIILLFTVGLLPVHAFGQYLDQKDRFNHPANHFFVTSGWRDEMLKRKRPVDDLQKYVIAHSSYIFEGKIIKQTYEYSAKPVNSSYGKERYALNTVLITYQFKGKTRSKTIILKTRHGYEYDTISTLSRHSFIPKTLDGYYGDAIFFCNKIGNIYNLEWEGSGYICTQTSGTKAFIDGGEDIVLKYGDHWQTALGLKDDEFAINNEPLGIDRESLYKSLAKLCNLESTKRRFLKRAEAFNGDEKRVGALMKTPTSISFTITSPIIAHQGLNESVTIQANFSGADVFNASLLDSVGLVDAERVWKNIPGFPIVNRETLLNLRHRDSCTIVGNQISFSLNSIQKTYGSGYIKILYNGNAYYTTNKLDIEYSLRNRFYLINHGCTKGLRFKLHTSAEPYRATFDAALQKWRDSLPTIALILETGNSTLPFNTLRTAFIADTGRVIVYMDTTTVGLPIGMGPVPPQTAFMSAVPYSPSSILLLSQAFGNGVLVFNPTGATTAYMQSTFIHEIGHGLGIRHNIDATNIAAGNIITQTFYTDNITKELLFWTGQTTAPYADLTTGRKKVVPAAKKMLQISQLKDWGDSPLTLVGTLNKPFLAQTFLNTPSNPIKKCVRTNASLLFQTDSFPSTTVIPTTFLYLINQTTNQELSKKGQKGGRVYFSMSDFKLKNNDLVYCKVVTQGCSFKSAYIPVNTLDVNLNLCTPIKQRATGGVALNTTGSPANGVFACTNDATKITGATPNQSFIPNALGNYTVQYSATQNGLTCTNTQVVTVDLTGCRGVCPPILLNSINPTPLCVTTPYTAQDITVYMNIPEIAYIP